MELHEALTQITEIRLQMARTQVFRGYHSVPVAFSGLLALAAAAIQSVWLPDPAQGIFAYLTLWIGVAVISLCAAGVEMWIHCQRSASPLTREITWLAVEQFLPAVVGGALLTYVLVIFASESLWLLPGLWQIIFSLGIFASCRLLPRATFWIGVFYMFCAVICLTLARGEAALAPWAMGIPFCMGQFLAAAVLYWTLERKNVSQ
jgi:hypothetical protein